MPKSKLRSAVEALAAHVHSSCCQLCKLFWFYKKLILFILIPFVLGWVFLHAVPRAHDYDATVVKAARCAFVVVLMGSFWALNVLPMPMTALLPVVCYPVLLVADSNTVCQQYMTSNNMLFLGGLLVSTAIEETRLHERVALQTLMVFGTRPRWLMAGLMSVAAVLSMWISNTATTAMLLPIAQGVCLELAQQVPLASRIRSVSSIRRRHHHSHLTSTVVVDLFSSASRGNNKTSVSSRVPLVSGVARSSSSDESVTLVQLRKADDVAKRKLSLVDDTTATTVATDGGSLEFPLRTRRVLRAQRSVGDFQRTASNDEELEVPSSSSRLRAVLHTYPPPIQHLFGGIMLCIAYAANIGGIATLIGTPTNLIFKANLDSYYSQQQQLNFASFMLFGVPCALLSLLACWLYMQWVFCDGGFRSLFRRRRRQQTTTGGGLWQRSPTRRSTYNVNELKISPTALQARCRELGSLSWAEGSTTVFFVVLFLAWILRQPGAVRGWGDRLQLNKYVQDAQPAIVFAVLLFIWPFHRPRWPPWMGGDEQQKSSSSSSSSYRTLLNWNTVEKNFPWGVVLLLGGGVAMADGVKASGLGDILGKMLANVAVTFPPWLCVVLISVTVSLVTEVVSNTAATTVAVPILFQLARGAGQNPIYYSLPAAIASSFAFMLPVATPPNAIVFSCGWLKLSDMLKVGWMVNLLCTAVLVVCMHTTAVLAFNVLQLPEWANVSSVVTNDTTASMLTSTTTTMLSTVMQH